MTHKLIKTDDYILVVDDSEIKVRDYYLRYNKSVLRCTKMELIFNDAINRHEVIIYTNNAGDPYERSRDSIKKIIAHLPLNAPILEGVDLLPPYSRHQEDGLDNAVMEFKERYGSLGVTDYELSAFSKGYNKAREVCIGRIEKDILNNPYYKDSPRLREGAMMVKIMLESSQYPTEFECELEHIPCPDGINGCLVMHYRPKTTTNAQGKRVWVGKYK